MLPMPFPTEGRDGSPGTSFFVCFVWKYPLPPPPFPDAADKDGVGRGALERLSQDTRGMPSTVFFGAGNQSGTLRLCCNLPTNV